ncbi:MAG: ATP-binding protein, partial [Arenimonas sp.]
GVERRDEAARELASALGADELLVLLHDPDADAMMPAAGWRKTLPGGSEWRDLLHRSLHAGVHRGDVPWSGCKSLRKAVGCAEDGFAILLIGGEVSEEDSKLICSMIPLLKAALTAQQALAAATGELQVARSEIRQATALMKSLDETRAELDRSLTQLDWQARSLEQARSRAEQATRSKDEFMAMLGHELRNPLAPIKTALELLKMRGIWSQEHEVMQRQSNHMIRLVEDLLDVSRIAGGKLTLNRSPTQVSTIIARALETAAPLIDQRRQRVRLDVPETGLCVSGDPARLAQVFSNLLTNASKYSDIECSIEVTARREGEVVRVAVDDHGIGIEASMLEDVFALFHQQGRGLDRAQGGLGLGLAIVRNLVTLHDGKVEAYSAGPGQGSTFVVWLPVCEAVAEGSTDASTIGIANALDRPRSRILLVDDNADARNTLAHALRTLGHEVSAAADGFEALEVVDKFQPDFAFLDIGLPVMDGYELADRLRQRPGKPIRLVAVTGYGQPEDKARARTAGFLAHFVKPVDFAQLLAAMETLP